MSRVAEQFMVEVDHLIQEYSGVISLPTLVKEIGAKWNLKNDDNTANMLESYGYGVTFMYNRYVIGF